MKEISSITKLEKYIEQHELQEIFDPQIIDHSRLFEYAKGDMICSNGMDINYLLFLVAGEAKVFTTLDNGKIYLLRIEHALSVYGDLEVLFDKEYSANVEALGDCHCIGIPIEYVRETYLNHPEFLKYIIYSLSNRLDKISHMSTSNLLLPLRNKFASYLLAHKDKTDNMINIKSSFIDVAEQLGTTYRHLSRTMNEMVKEGLIDKHGKLMEIVQLDKLKKLAGNTYRY